MGFRFKTYANWWIRQSMDRALKDKARTIRLPVHVQERIKKLARLRGHFLSQTGREPTYDELGKAMGLPTEKIAFLSWHTNYNDTRSLDEELGEGFSLGDTLRDDQTPGPHQILENIELHQILTSVLSTLTPRQEEVIRSRYGLGVPSSMTLEELGTKFGMTRERVRQIQEKALTKLVKKVRHLRYWLDE